MSRSAIAGGVLWTCLAAAVLLHGARLTTVELLFLLGPLVIVPLGLSLCARLAPEIGVEIPSRSVQRLQLPAALCAAAAFFLPQGIAAAFLVLPWLGFGCVIGLTGLLNLIHRNFKNLRAGCVIISFLYLPVGCAWLVASRVGLSPMGFQEPIVLLTAVHFHSAGFAAPLLACATGSALHAKSAVIRRILNIVTAGVMAGPGLLAAGFVIGPRVKLAAALVVAGSEVGLCPFLLSCARAMRPRLAQVLIAVSAASVLLSMVLACIWAIGEYPFQPFVHLDEMARFHGTANAFGFILCGLLGWTLAVHSTAVAKGELQ